MVLDQSPSALYPSWSFEFENFYCFRLNSFPKDPRRFLGLFRLLTRCSCRFLERLVRDVLWIAHIIVGYFIRNYNT
jgi:hypothetical protein